MVKAEKLSREEIGELRAFLAREPLENYEWLWVLESCLETPSSAVYSLGAGPWSAGLLILHRQCVWLRVENEMLLEDLLAPLPGAEVYRFYTTSPATVDMLERWFPHGQLSRSQLCVRKLTSSWRKRFPVEVSFASHSGPAQGELVMVQNGGGEIIAGFKVEQAVAPWYEVVEWNLAVSQDVAYWRQQAFGAVTAALLNRGNPVVVRAEDRELYNDLEGLGYREFCQLYYYVAAGNE